MSGTSFQQEILKRLSELGPVYIVGGAVRDAQLGIPAKDVDAVTTLSLREIEMKLLEWGYAPHWIGATFQTISLFRSTDRLDIVSFNGEIEADALRRDFTLNALYQDVRTGEVYDPQGGLCDLRARRLKACGSAIDRFKEDPLRILRLVRLSVRYGLEIERESWLAAVDHVPQICEVSVERICEELGRILVLDEVDKALRLLEELGYFKAYIPELDRLKGLVQNKYHTKDAWEHTCLVVKNTPPTVLLRLAGLFHDLGKWETASRECYVWGIIRQVDQDFQINARFKLVGKDLEKWVNQEVKVNGGRLDNYPDTIVVKRIQAACLTKSKELEMVSDGKRHFLQHERESARLLERILSRFRWSIVLPQGSLGEQELKYLVGHHMLGTLTFMKQLHEEADSTILHKKACRFAWEIGWTGQDFNVERVENLLDLWRADFLGGKQAVEKNMERLGEVQREIRKACTFLMERASLLEWDQFRKFVREKGLEGKQYGRYKEQVRVKVMLDVKYSLADPQFLEREYVDFLKLNS